MNIRIRCAQIDKLQGNALSRTLRDAFLLAASKNTNDAAKVFEWPDRSRSRSTIQPWTTIMTVEEPRVKVQREPRRQLNHHATWISVDDGITRRECTVLDVSPGGARIVMDVPIDIRDRFVLALVPSHPKRQECEVVWRRGKTYGVKFLA